MKKSLLSTVLLTLFSLSILAQDGLLVVDGEKSNVDLDSFDPNTIESVTVLKDQAAINVYGKDGENGVIIIKSKNVDFKKEIRPEPLVIIDGEKYNSGVIIEDEKINSGMKSISRSDIKTIAVLKDSTATKVFGDAGKNGVIVITTK
jgi:bla regulator protein blaR1